MKFAQIIALVAIVGLTSCSKPDSGILSEAGTISVTPASQSVAAAGESFSVEIKSNKGWQSETSSSWVSVSPSRGSGNTTVKVTVNPNVAEERDATVTFRLLLEDKSASLKINQATGISADGIRTLTIAQFIGKPDSETDWYRLTGEIVSISSHTYGDFYMKDDTGFIYVYGLAPEKGGKTEDFSKLNLKASDVVTIVANRYTYSGVNETKNAYYEKHTSGKSYPGFVAKSAKANWLELPETTDSEDGNLFVHHKHETGLRNYSAYFSTADRVSRWTCYPYVYRQGGDGRNDDPYAFDPLVDPQYQACLTKSYQNRTFSDIPGEEFIRGHMVPSNDRSGRANYDVFLATNIMPQSEKINGATWSDLELKIHTNWAAQSDTLYVVTGTVLDDSTHKVKDVEGKEITVPTGIYKAVLALTKQGEYKGLAVFFENKGQSSATFTKSMAMSIDELEKIIGVDLYVNLPDEEEKAVEAADPQADNWWWQ